MVFVQAVLQHVVVELLLVYAHRLKQKFLLIGINLIQCAFGYGKCVGYVVHLYRLDALVQEFGHGSLQNPVAQFQLIACLRTSLVHRKLFII